MSVYPSLGCNPARYHHCCVYLRLDRRTISVQYRPLKIKLYSTLRAQELTPTTPTDKWALVIRVYDTPALIKDVWIFNPGGIAIKRFSTEIGPACLAVVSSCSRPVLSALPSAPYALAPLS